MQNMRDEQVEPETVHGGPRLPEMDRIEFLKRTSRFACLAIAAGSLGWLAGCGSRTLSQDAQPPQQNGAAQAPASSPSTTPQAQDTTPATPANEASVIDCRFYDNGICSRTGEACTECILR